MANNLKIYCHHCGAGNVYTLQKPKFCQACGQLMGGAVASHPPSPRPSEATDEEHFETPIMDGLDFEAMPNNNNALTLGDIVEASDPTTPPRERQQNNVPKIEPPSHDQIMAEFQKEAGTLRKK